MDKDVNLNITRLGTIKALLKTTKAGTTSVSRVAEEARLPLRLATARLQKLEEEDLVEVYGDIVSVQRDKRLTLLTEAISAGGDLADISGLLRWDEFESLVARMAEVNSYSVTVNLRFKHGAKWWQADVVACKEPLVICIDCKHLRSRQAMVLRKAVALNIERAHDLAVELTRLRPKLSIRIWPRTTVMPLIVMLKPDLCRLIETVPKVPVNQLRDFLDRLPAEISSFTSFNLNLQDCQTTVNSTLANREIPST